MDHKKKGNQSLEMIEKHALLRHSSTRDNIRNYLPELGRKSADLSLIQSYLKRRL